MSWFNNDAICRICSDLETQIKRKMRESGENPDQYEGCGFVPNGYLAGEKYETG
jgi:hypothetical protein